MLAKAIIEVALTHALRPWEAIHLTCYKFSVCYRFAVGTSPFLSIRFRIFSFPPYFEQSVPFSHDLKALKAISNLKIFANCQQTFVASLKTCLGLLQPSEVPSACGSQHWSWMRPIVVWCARESGIDNLSFIWDKCCYLMECLHVTESKSCLLKWLSALSCP